MCVTEGSLFNDRETSMEMCKACYAVNADYVLSAIKFFSLHMSVWMICAGHNEKLKGGRKIYFWYGSRNSRCAGANFLPHFAFIGKKSLSAHST